MIPSTIRAGFKATGVYPLDQFAVKVPGKHTPRRKSIPIEDVAKSNDISYLSLHRFHLRRPQRCCHHFHSGSSRGVSEVSGNWSAFPSGQTTNNTVKGSQYGHSYRHAHEQNKSCAHIHTRVMTFTMDIMF